MNWKYLSGYCSATYFLLLIYGLVLAALLFIRYGVIEAGRLPIECGAAFDLAEPLQCQLKWMLVQSFIDQRLGWLSLLLGAGAVWLQQRWIAVAGGLTGLAGLVLYSFDPAAVGALLSLLVLARGANQHARREQ